MYICPVKAPLAPAPWDYRNSSWKSRQQESGLNEKSQAHVLHCSHTINAEKWRTWHCRTALDSCRVYTRVGDLASTALLEWVYVHCSAVMNEHSLRLITHENMVCSCTEEVDSGFLISLQLSQLSSLHRLLSAPSSSVRYDPGAATGRLVDRRHRFSLPGHVHIHFRQTLGQVTIAVHLGEPGEPRTTGLYWMWWTGPDWILDLSICGHHLCSRIWTTICLDLVLKLHCTSDSI